MLLHRTKAKRKIHKITVTAKKSFLILLKSTTVHTQLKLKTNISAPLPN